MTRIDIARRSDEELYGIAHTILSRRSALDRYPIEIDHYLEKFENIVCLPSHSLTRFCDSGGAISLDRSTIYLDRHDYYEPRQHFRLRMTIAHEFAHAQLHSSIFNSIKTLDDARALIAYFTEHPDVYRLYEVQAFTLGGYLLVPDQTIETVTHEVIRVMKQKAAEIVELSSEAAWKIIAERVARKYEVTRQVAEKRLRHSGLWLKATG